MKSKEYDEFGATNLRVKGVGFDQRVTRDSKTSKTVYIEPGMLGIKLLGKLDFLVNHCHWHLVIRKRVYVG